MDSVSLRETLIGLKPPISSKYSFDPNGINRKTVLKAFNEGANIDYETVYKQWRIRQAFEVNQQEVMVFCPNVLVTPQIFDILKNYKSDCLIYGGYGISKTVSIALFNHLNSFNCKFWL
jgi:hypothetical protein